MKKGLLKLVAFSVLVVTLASCAKAPQVEVNLVEAVPENVCYECGSIHPTKNMLQRGSNSYMCMKCYAYELGVK